MNTNYGLRVGEEYTWEQLSDAFGFKPKLFSVGGGMLPLKQGPLLLITHPGGAKSFDYGDRWDGQDLIYTGRGQRGNQRLIGPNRDVAEKRRRLEVLEATGPAHRDMRHAREQVHPNVLRILQIVLQLTCCPGSTPYSRADNS